MSTAAAGKKRKANVLEEDASAAGQSTSGLGGEVEKPSQSSQVSHSSRPVQWTIADYVFSGRSFPSLQPFDTVADLTALDPQDIFGGIRGLSEARYEKDLYRVFNESASTQNKGLVAMHKTWFECRNPTANELWASRYHEAQSYKPTENRNIMKSVLTFQTMRDQFNDADNPQLAQKLMVLHFDYIMLMCLNGAIPGKKDNQDEIKYRFPDYEEQFESLAGELRRMQLSKQDGPRSLAPIDESIPTATRDMINSLLVDSRNVSGHDKIAGCTNAKENIRNAVFLGEVLPHLADIEYGWKGILLHGPPGTGKTQLALSVAAEEKCNVFHVMSCSIVDKYLGATERNVRALFKIAQENTPSVIFIDEVDALFSVRETSHVEASTQRLKSEFLSALTMYTKVVVIGATNLPWALDSAFLRRFDRHIHIGLPNLVERVEILKLKLSICLHELKDADFEIVARYCDGFTGDTIRQAIAQEWNAMYKKIKTATRFRKASLNGQEVYCTCPSSHPEAEKVSLNAISDRLYPEPITKDGLLSAMKSLQRTVAMTKAGEEKHVRWSHEMFQEL